jgi:hypothetical protein
MALPSNPHLESPMADRRVKYLPLEQIKEAARNPKQHAEAELRASIGRFGLGDLPLLDDRTGRLVSGHGRIHDLAHRRAEGETPPDGVQIGKDGTWLVPVVVGWASRSDAEAEAYLTAANRLSELGGWDEAALAELLSEMAEDDLDLALLTGFSAADLEDLLAAAEPLPEAYETVPATDAHYAETPEQRAARQESIDAYQPRSGNGSGYVELVLILTVEDRAEYDRLAAQVREVLGEMRPSELALRAMRNLAETLEALGELEPAPAAEATS